MPEADWAQLKEWCGSRASLAWGRPTPDEAQIRDAIGGNLCRCTGYQQIVDAIRSLAERA